jgi:hypothetical protein
MPGQEYKDHVLPMQHNLILCLTCLNQKKGDINMFGMRQAADGAGFAEHCSFYPVWASMLDQLPTKTKDLTCHTDQFMVAFTRPLIKLVSTHMRPSAQSRWPCGLSG